jgi:hypothetical protein
MGWKDFLSTDLRDLFSGPRRREERRQCEFHLKVAEPLRGRALGDPADPKAWAAYHQELGRALAGWPESFDARWLRAEAAQQFFGRLASGPDPESRAVARAWDEDLHWLLLHFPDEPPRGATLAAAREMRDEYERRCRAYKLG